MGWKVQRLTIMQWSNLIKCGLFFNIDSPSIGVAALGFPWYSSSHPHPRKIPQLQINYDLISGPILLPSQVFFHVGEHKIVRWCQIRRIYRVINQFKITFTHSSHCNHRLACRSIVLVIQDSLRRFPGDLKCIVLVFESHEVLTQYGFFWKETMEYQESLNLIHTKFHCCGTTPC